jgi:hypothetical protein
LSTVESFARAHKEELRRERLARCKRDLWFLATDVLKRGWNPAVGGEDSPFPGKGLTEELHKPLFAWSDARRNELSVGYWGPRWHHKTEQIIAEIIQDILIDPCTSDGYFHSVDALAAVLIAEVGWHLQHNPEVRKLEPIGVDDDGKPYNILPARNAKRFMNAEQLTVRRHRFSRFPTLFGAGAGSEISGRHMRKAYLDDIITLRTIQNSELPKIATWYQSNLMPVVDDGIIRVRATRWHPDAIYESWIASPDWHSVVLPACLPATMDFMEDPSVIDWSSDKIMLPAEYKLQEGIPVYGPRSYRETQRKKLIYFEREMKADFPAQMMNDPSPAAEKPWDASKCEHYIGIQEYGRVPRGTRFVLGDPAPAKVGSLDLTGARVRADGSKDEWAWQVVELRANGTKQEIVWLDGTASYDWTRDEGFEEGCRLAKKWGTPFVAMESVGQSIALYEDDLRRAARKTGTALTIVKLANTYKGKNVQFSALCSRAERDELLILDTIPEEFRAGTLHQCREWRALDSGRNALKYDDRANALSFACDPALQEYAPQGADHEEPYEAAVGWESSRGRYWAY